ncbi:hypothetical protein [Microbacterium sp. 77mftsu3.1]|uniref:hypothetical protein n=1 Tax=Microbacterium sp. 77mftsu3.1 TaxID=1761802 RepID=UPI00037C39D7|nr:hypothetical protein [Microbacterium sp. 77mftsu3.1]SDG22814.1 hypothetical protein SAMN04488590_0250 [Microbacterium sp. 77mftsu3.1]
MAAATPRRRTQVEALDDLAAAMREVAYEQRTANLLAAVAMGVSALEHDDRTPAKTPAAIERKDRRNAVRAEIRDRLNLEGGA